jgi:hypothetical protein
MRPRPSGGNLTHSFKLFAAFVTIAFGLWQAAANARKPVEQAPAEIDGALRVYRSIRFDLPASGQVGFLSVSDNPTLNSANHYIAQYALAPRVVVSALDDEPPFVVSGINASAAIDADPRLAGYELSAVHDMGVRIFKRTNAP